MNLESKLPKIATLRDALIKIKATDNEDQAVQLAIALVFELKGKGWVIREEKST
jgi:selenocysteine-specific translation elongation factor